MISHGGDTITVIGVTDGPTDKLGVPARIDTETVVGGVSLDALKTSETEDDTDLVTTRRTIYQDRPIHPALLALKSNDRVRTADGLEWRVDGDPYFGTYLSGGISHIRFVIRRG